MIKQIIIVAIVGTLALIITTEVWNSILVEIILIIKPVTPFQMALIFVSIMSIKLYIYALFNWENDKK